MKGKREIGKRIKRLRESKGLSQVKFAREVKVSPPTVSRWESGEITPPPRVLQKLSEMSGGDAGIWFLEQAGIESYGVGLLPKEIFNRPKQGQMVAVPRFEEAGKGSSPTSPELLLPAWLAPTLTKSSYFVATEKTWGYPLMPGDILFLDESSKGAKNLLPYWGQLVLVDSTGDVEKLAGVHWEQIIGRLFLVKDTHDKFGLTWNVILQPWTVFDRNEPFFIGLWRYQFPRKMKIGEDGYPADFKIVEEAEKVAGERAKNEAPLYRNFRILGRLIGWFRPQSKS